MKVIESMIFTKNKRNIIINTEKAEGGENHVKKTI